MKTKLFTLFLALAASVGTMLAYDAKIGDLYYNLNATNKTAEVTYGETNMSSYSMSSVDIPSSFSYWGTDYTVVRIGMQAFRLCSNLTSVTIPNSVTSIGAGAFCYCNLNSITIPNSVVYIEEGAFAGCSSLISVTIPNSVVSIGEDAFHGCGLTSATIPNSVTSIGEYAFFDCGYLSSITIPNSVTSIGNSAFSGCSGLTSISVETGNTIYDSRDKCNAIIETASNTLLFGCQSTIIPNSVTSIGEDAFSGCSSLTSVTIPNGVTSIGNYAFHGCSSLTSVTIPNSVTNIGNYAFYGCSSLTSVTIPNSVTSIENYAFYDCSSLISLIIGNSVTRIGDSAFEGCRSLTSINWNAKTCANFSSSAFPQSVTSFTIGNEVEHIPAYLCSSLSQLTSITIPNSVTSIGKYAFCNCSSLTTIVIPNGITYIGEYTFLGCNSLTSVGWNAKTCANFSSSAFPRSVTSFTIGNEVERIPAYLCYGLSQLTSVAINIPNSVIEIGKYAFYNCRNLETLSLGKSLEKIGDNAFNGCERIIDIYCYAERVPDVQTSTFDGVSRKAYVWVPANRLRNYQTHEIWGEFDVKAMAAEGVNASSVTIVPDYNTASVIWPAVENADTYELAITDKDGKTICTLVFNGDGILQSIAFGAPSRNNAPEHTQSTGFRFEVSGLEEGTSYNYSIVAKDVTSKALQTFNGSFKTLGGVDALTDISTDKTSLRKEMINGQLFILRGDKTYTAQGQEVR